MSNLLILQIYGKLKLDFLCQYDKKDVIGRMYRRQDEIGTPYCVTVDFESLEDGCINIRERDSLKLERISINKLAWFIC